MSWIIFALLSAFFASLVAILSKMGLKNVDSTLATTIRSIVMAVFLIGASLLSNKFANFSTSFFEVKDWILIILAGIAGAISWLFYFFALKSGPATAVAALDRLSLVFVAILAVIFLSEQFSLKVVLGIILMVLGAVVVSL